MRMTRGVRRRRLRRSKTLTPSSWPWTPGPGGEGGLGEAVAMVEDLQGGRATGVGAMVTRVAEEAEQGEVEAFLQR